jgi:hypothetical protein
MLWIVSKPFVGYTIFLPLLGFQSILTDSIKGSLERPLTTTRHCPSGDTSGVSSLEPCLPYTVGLEWRVTTSKYHRFAARNVLDLGLEGSAGVRREGGLYTDLDRPICRYTDIGHTEVLTRETFELQVH